MKKILFMLVIAAAALSGCKNAENTVVRDDIPQEINDFIGDDIAKIDMVCNNYGNISDASFEGDDLEELKNWFGNAEYEEADFDEETGIDSDVYYIFNTVGDGEDAAVELYIKEDGDYVCMGDKLWSITVAEPLPFLE